jgi:hypothetical protein
MGAGLIFQVRKCTSHQDQVTSLTRGRKSCSPQTESLDASSVLGGGERERERERERDEGRGGMTKEMLDRANQTTSSQLHRRGKPRRQHEVKPPFAKLNLF